MSLRSERWVLCIWPNGHEKLIKRSAARKMIEEGDASYAGRKVGRESVTMSGVIREWRKTTRMFYGEKLGMVVMGLVRL